MVLLQEDSIQETKITEEATTDVSSLEMENIVIVGMEAAIMATHIALFMEIERTNNNQEGLKSLPP